MIVTKYKKKSIWQKMIQQRFLLLLILPGLLYYIIFRYVPMYGIVIGFKDYKIYRGIMESPWVGFKYFKMFFRSPYFWRLMKNTLLLDIYSLIWGFPVPIIFALLLNEVKSTWFKKLTQTISYLPHFISVVIVIGLLKQLISPNSGVINQIVEYFSGQPINFLMEPGWFRTLYISSGIWKNFGWGAIIYFAAISNIDPQLYEAAIIDGAGRFQCIWHITLPSIKPTIIILLLLKLGGLMKVGFTKILLMYNPGTFVVADVIQTFEFRSGIQQANYSYGTAIGLFNSVIAFILIIIFNYISRRVSETSLW